MCVWVWMGLGRGSEGRDPGPGWIEQNVGCRGGGRILAKFRAARAVVRCRPVEHRRAAGKNGGSKKNASRKKCPSPNNPTQPFISLPLLPYWLLVLDLVFPSHPRKTRCGRRRAFGPSTPTS